MILTRKMHSSFAWRTRVSSLNAALKGYTKWRYPKATKKDLKEPENGTSNLVSTVAETQKGYITPI
jgi:hypothetical protein